MASEEYDLTVGVMAAVLHHRFTILLATLLALLLVAPVGLEVLATAAPKAASWGSRSLENTGCAAC
jgi:hypothetical protein